MELEQLRQSVLAGRRRVAKAEDALATARGQLEAQESQLRPAEEKTVRDEGAYSAAVEGATAKAAAGAKGGMAACDGDGHVGMAFSVPESDEQAARLKRVVDQSEERKAKRACAEPEARCAADAARACAAGAKAVVAKGS